MNVTTRKRRSRKGVKWINHFYSKWYHKRLAIGNMLACGVISQGLARINAIKSASFGKSATKLNKSIAISKCAVDTFGAALKAKMMFVN